MNKLSPIVSGVMPSSPLFDSGIQSGWTLLTVNGSEIEDILDYRIALACNTLELTFIDSDAQPRLITVEKSIDADPGLIFSSPVLDNLRCCANRCLFCFVDQMPPGLRNSLYIKDDDYRLSFLHGSYLSLSNFSQTDIQRIIDLRISPLYISVQAYNDLVRRELLGYPLILNFWALFDRLLENNIELHCQIVVCPGYNDAEVLEETVSQLARRRPGVITVSVVPVGLTEHRRNLPLLSPVSKDTAESILSRVLVWQSEAIDQDAGCWIWAADELYLIAERLDLLPEATSYEDYPLLENGIGIIRLFYEEWSSFLPLPETSLSKPVIIISGVSGAKALHNIAEDLKQVMKIEIKTIINRLFGETVTVTGLVCGRDILAQLPPEECCGRILLIPDVMLRDGSDLFLDDLTYSQLAQLYESNGAEVKLVSATASGLYHALFPTGKRRVRPRLIKGKRA